MPETKSDAREIDELLSRVALADRAAFDTLYQRTAPRLFGVALRILHDRNDAEDVLQESFIKIWRRGALYMSTEDGAPLQWLTSVVRNTAIDWRRRRRFLNADPAIDVADDAPTPEAAAVQSGEARLLINCLETLGVEKARLIRTAYFTGMTYAELSAAEGTPLGTMKSWMRRALARLRDCIEGAPDRKKSGSGR
jgi:RNA polymerase sigma-70 factor (ECF subfamily)